MPQIHLTSLNSAGELPGWAIIAIGVGLILWLWSVVHIARAKTEDPFDRVVWLLVVLMLNFVGTLLYVFFDNARLAEERQGPISEEEIKRRANEGTL